MLIHDANVFNNQTALAHGTWLVTRHVLRVVTLLSRQHEVRWSEELDELLCVLSPTPMQEVAMSDQMPQSPDTVEGDSVVEEPAVEPLTPEELWEAQEEAATEQ